MWKHACKMLGWMLFVLVFVFVLLYGNTAKAELRIKNDCGGQIGRYLQSIRVINLMEEMVVVDGNCLSACTLVLGLVPKNRICATDKARFGFHQSWMPDENGHPVRSEVGTKFLWEIYPEPVRTWINKNGGLKKKMIYLQGAELAHVVEQCHTVPQGALVAQASVPSRTTINTRPCQ